eukprot:Mycagemm_TRINITY_DN9915_c0_g1::TRINITY_DN9915_c0_g1_i1::g.3389::m.3389 type:complete len:110 gc:universal TRINITY_DN9915_c0_g1_i1:995-666(-)
MALAQEVWWCISPPTQKSLNRMRLLIASRSSRQSCAPCSARCLASSWRFVRTSGCSPKNDRRTSLSQSPLRHRLTWSLRGLTLSVYGPLPSLRGSPKHAIPPCPGLTLC